MLNFIAAKDDDVVTTGAVGRAMLQFNLHHQHTNFIQAGCPSS